MTPVFQTEVSSERGDCLRACVASLFDLEISQVPHFLLFGARWHNIFVHFLQGMGCEFHGSGWAHSHKYPKDHPHFDGFVLASVKSKTLENVTHAVVMDLDGVVVHDPNPNERWKGINVLESEELIHWRMIDRKPEV